MPDADSTPGESRDATSPGQQHADEGSRCAHVIQQRTGVSADTATFICEIVQVVTLLATIALILYAVTGVWPPFVAVSSGSMEPHLERGDLVVVAEPTRYTSTDIAAHHGVVTYQAAAESPTTYRSFGASGNVIVYVANGTGQPIIHRARFWVTAGENWYDEANLSYIQDASNCAELPNCPAPHAGFITKGDANQYYDQVIGISEPVKPSWVAGEAKHAVPYLGYVRLLLF